MMMMLMMTTMTKTRPSIIHLLAALSLVLSFHPCACTQLYGNTIHAVFYSYCSDNPSGVFYECGDPAGRCICQDHTAYCNPTSPALPVLPDDVYILDLCNNYFGDFEFPAVNNNSLQLTSQFFSHMKNVTELRMLNVDIRHEVFVLLANVTKVNISCIWHLAADYGKTLNNFLLIPNLRSFSSGFCNLRLLSLHSGLQSPLQSFHADWCSFGNRTLDLKAFNMFKDLKRISITDCGIDQVQPAVLPALEELILYHNDLTSFPQTCDMHNNSFFPSLKRISLSYNKISQIGGKGSSTCLPQVTEIDVSGNPITSIKKGVFDAQSCPKLQTINISSEWGNDKPPTIHTEGFIFTNPSIKTLDLTNRRLKFGPCTPENCVAQNTFANSSLTHLYLDENDFGDIDSYRFFLLFGGLRNLTYLSVRNSNFFALRILDRNFCDFPLQYLDLSNTPRVCRWIDKPCHNSNIKIVKADKANSWEYSPASSGFTTYDPVIIHTDPVTCAVAYTFDLLRFALMGSAIEHISFRENNLDFGQRCTENKTSCVFSNSFENKPNLRVLLLDGNDFSTVDAERFVSLFGKLTNLKNLSLSNCGIKHVSAEMFHRFPRLQYLDLNNNKLTTLSSQTFSASPSLNVLYLHSNVLSVVPEGLLSSDQRRGMTNFTLYQNTLVCSCDSRWLQSWLLSDPDLFDYPSQSYSCFDDPTKSLASYTMPDQACMLGQEATIAIIITSTVTITALTVFSLLFRYRWSFRLLLYYAMSGRPNYQGRRRNYVYDVFVSYDQEDFQWMREQLMPELEDRMGLRVCIHQRDFIPGHYIVTNITQAVEHSKKVLMVFSRHFVLSRWCQFEVDFCLSNAIENRDSLLIVCLDDVASDETVLTGAMKAALSTMTYIQWVNRRDAIHFFWERVRQSLGDVRPRDREAGRRRQREVLDIDGRVRIEMQVMDF